MTCSINFKVFATKQFTQNNNIKMNIKEVIIFSTILKTKCRQVIGERCMQCLAPYSNLFLKKILNSHSYFELSTLEYSIILSDTLILCQQEFLLFLNDNKKYQKNVRTHIYIQRFVKIYKHLRKSYDNKIL